MSSQKMVGKTECQALDEVGFRERYSDAFDLDETLTSEIYYQILLDVKFDEEKALWQVVNRIRRPHEFLVPKGKKVTTFQFNPPCENSSSSGFGKKRSAPCATQVSEDEPDLSNGSQESIRDLPIISPCVSHPSKIPSSIQNRESSQGIVSTSEEDEDVRPKKKRRSLLPIRATTKSDLSRTTKKDSNRASSFKKTQSKPAISFKSTSSSGEETSFDASSSIKQSSQCLVPKDELSDTLGPLSDEESDTNSDDVSDVADNLASPERKSKIKATPRGKAQQEIKTETTTWMNKLARAYFAKCLAEAPASNFGELEVEDKLALRDLTTHLEEIREEAWDHEVKGVEFIGPGIWDDPVHGRTGYASVNIDGVIYRPNDCVILRSDPCALRVKGKVLSSQSDDEEPDELPDPWYAHIVYLFEDEHSTPMAHFRWFEHGSKTVMKEVAGPHELFLLSQCDDNPLSSVASKIQVDFRGETTPENDGAIEQEFMEKHHYFYRMHYDPKSEKFTDTATYSTHNRDIQEPNDCECCKGAFEKNSKDKFQLIEPESENNKRSEGFHLNGVHYFLLDFVYIFSDEKKPYQIGQIKEMSLDDGELIVLVDLFKRYDRFHKDYFEEFQDGQNHAARDNRRLYKACRTKNIWADQIDGKCYVQHRQDIESLERYKDQPDRFWADLQVDEMVDPRGEIRPRDLVPLSTLEYSKRTVKKLEADLKRMEAFRKNGKKLRGMDIFAGLGGLSKGMHMSDAVDTLWAIERDTLACLTFKKNFPNTEVFNVDANILLDRAIRREKEEELEPLYDSQGELVPDLPRPGEVDFIYGGPPCQGFSISNRYQKADDIKNSLIVLYLSFLEFYRPKYFLLENVRGILQHRLGATQVEIHKTIGGIEKGTVKFILRTMTSLGYQAQYTTLQCAEYGTPQSRRRVIFWASKLEFPLPSFPQPENVVELGSSTSSWHKTRRSAPHPAVSVGDAISDLPAFEWINTHKIMAQTQQERSDRAIRRLKICQVEVEQGARSVGKNHQSYTSRPLSEFQRKARAGVPKDGLLNHVTNRFNQETVERVCSIPMVPGADHRDMPKKLQMNFLTNATAKRNRFYPGRFGRLDYEGIFQTCMTDITPSGKNGKILHPTQHRCVSVREYARAQGIPDSFVFDLEVIKVIDAIREIGNSVPVPLGFRLGDELLQILVAMHEIEQQTLDHLKIAEIPKGHIDHGHGKGSRDDPITLN